MLVIDKNVDNLTRIADRHYIIERGRDGMERHVGAVDRRAGFAAPVSGDLRLSPAVIRERSGAPAPL